MGWFSRRREAPPQEERAISSSMFFPSGYDFAQSTAGVNITTDTSLQNIAVWACQRVLVSTISMLPVDVIRTNGAIRTLVDPQPMMVRSPSGRVSRRGWVAQNVRALLGGNMYGRVVAIDSIGRATQVETIHPDDVRWQIVDGEEVPFVKGHRQTLWPIGDFWHVPASQFLMPGSRVAMNPTEYAKTSIGTGIAAERFGANFFRDGLNPTAIVKVDADINADQAMDIKRSIMNMARENREPAVFGKDIVDISPWTAKLSDSQFIDLLQFEVVQACRVYGVPPSMVYAAISGQNVTYSNIGQADMQYLKFSVAGWLVDFEDAWSDLIAQPHTVKFNVDALLRMDARARAELADIRLKSRTTTVNAVRALEDEPPFLPPAGEDRSPFDEPGIPGGNEPLGKVIKEVSVGVGTLITSDEGRQILNDAGLDLPIPGPPDLGPLHAPVPAAADGSGDTNA